MFGNLGRYNVTRHNWLRSKILQITFFRDVRFRVITVIVIRLVEAFSFLIFWQRNHLAAAPGDSSGGNNDLCGSEKKKVKVELFGWSLNLWHLLAWVVQWCPCRFSGSSLEVEQIPNNWSLKSWDILWQILPFHLSSQTLWRNSRSACSRCSHEVRRLKSLLELVQVITKAETCLLTWSGQNDEHIREQIPCRAWRYNSIQNIFQKSEKISRDWLNCSFDYLVRIFLHCGWKVFGNGMSVVTFNRKTH